MSRPVVVIPACTTLIEGYVFDAVGRKYTAAVAEVAECQPLLVPVGPRMSDIGSLLEVADAILLTGSRSNVGPEHYGEETPIKLDALDPLRDALHRPLDPGDLISHATRRIQQKHQVDAYRTRIILHPIQHHRLLPEARPHRRVHARLPDNSVVLLRLG